DANHGVAADDTVSNVTAGDGAHTFNFESVAHFGAALIRLGDNGVEQAFHGFLNFVGDLVNDVVGADVHVFLVGKIRGFAVWPHAEGDDDGAGSRSENDIALFHGTNTGTDNFQFDLVGGKSRQHFAEHFDGT